LLHYSI